MAINYEREGDPRWKRLGEGAVMRLWRAARHRDNFCYFPAPDGQMPTGWEATAQGWTVQGLAQFARATGSRRAEEMALRLAEYLKERAGIFDQQGRFLARHDSARGPALHFHHNANALLAILECALVTNRSDLAEFAKKGYLYARNTGSSLIGFFPEYIDDWPDERGVIDCETCCVADMIQLAIGLTEAGMGDYWDDVDRYLRNQFAEMQMQRSEWVERVTAQLPRKPVGKDETAENVARRAIGAFAGWASANDLYVGVGPGIMNCCTGNAARTLFRVWQSMIERHDQTLRLHTLLNRASPWADINSFLPYRGEVHLRLKVDCPAVELRMPEWVSAHDHRVECWVDGLYRSVAWQGRYVRIKNLPAGTMLRLRFPIVERKVQQSIGDVGYTLVMRGSEVVSIEPPGKNYPLYQRRQYRQKQIAWKRTVRYVEPVERPKSAK